MYAHPPTCAHAVLCVRERPLHPLNREDTLFPLYVHGTFKTVDSVFDHKDILTYLCIVSVFAAIIYYFYNAENIKIKKKIKNFFYF